METKALLVKGRVQGVLLRNQIKKKAEDLELNGYVKNLENGCIKLVIQGGRNKILSFIKWLKHSPGFSGVEQVELLENEENNFLKFEIKRDFGFFRDQINSFSSLFGLNKRKMKKIPIHVAVIPDGNRRWARAKNMQEAEGHKKSAQYSNLISLMEETKKLGIKFLSVWAFSTENWKRDKKEIAILFELLEGLLIKLEKEITKNKIRFRHIGRKDRLPQKIVKILRRLESKTKEFKDFNLQICLDYGGRDEILRAIKNIVKSKKSLNPEIFSDYLDTKGIPDVDLIIRTSGEQRTSGFMPYQSTYAELYFAKKYFPDFKPRDLRNAVKDFSKRKRRFGGN